MKIDHLIAKLLYDYDCVVVPQLGGFVTHYRPAHIDEIKGIAHPSQKDIGFNRNLMRSDGLLEQAIQEAEGFTFEEASAELRVLVESYWTSLRNGETLNLQKVGVLFLDNYRNLRFEPSHEVNFLKSAFGFEAFKMPEPLAKPELIKVEEKGIIRPINPELVPAVEENHPFRQNRTMYWVAAATLIPFIGMSLYLGWSTDFKSPTNISVADLFPIRESENHAPKYKQRQASDMEIEAADAQLSWPEGLTVFPYSFETEAVDSTGVWINLEASKLAVESKAEIKLDNSFKSKKYHLIVGCFGEESNAEKLVNELKAMGHGADILDYHKGLYRVSLRSYTDYNTALEELDDLRSISRFKDIWMLKKSV